MNNIFIISDTHFGHDNLYSFVDYNSNKVRDFVNSQECDTLMIENWNKTVQTTDKVYHLGDVVMSKRVLEEIMPRLNGRKILIKGNHDREKLSIYAKYFKDIRGAHNLDTCILTHVPIHPMSFSRFKLNIHGNTHGNQVRTDNQVETDNRYFNACVEVINYTPISFDSIKQISSNINI